MSYFECNLPREIPNYYHSSIRAVLSQTVERVYARTDKLNKALAESGLKPATFHKLAKNVFDSDPIRFDELTPSELAQITKLNYRKGNEVPDREEFPNAIVFFDTAFVSTKDWEALRHFGIGGSDSSVIMDISPYQTKEGIWYDKTGYPKLVDADKGSQVFFDRGHFLESTVIDIFCKKVGAMVIPETRMFQSKKFPHSTANLDGVLRMANGELVIFEAKTAVDAPSKIKEWYADGVPANYVTQVHQYLGVIDDPRIKGAYIGMLPTSDKKLAGQYIGSEYDPSRYQHHYIVKDKQYEDEILRAEDKFWTCYIAKGIRPKPSGDGEIDKKINLQYKPSPLSNPETKKATFNYVSDEDFFSKLFNAEEECSVISKKLNLAKNYRDSLRAQACEKMKGAKEALVVDSSGDNNYLMKNTIRKSKSVDYEMLNAFYPEAYEKCVTPTETLIFSVKHIAPPKP